MKHQVLLVEDSKVIQQMYRSKLIMEQFAVVTADNGMEAIKALSVSKPDIILLDLMMPIMDGYKVLQVVKTDQKMKDIPILVFSAKGQPDEIEKALSLGASGYIIKSVTKPNEVVEKIRAVLAQKPAEKEVAHYRIGIREDVYDAGKLSDDFKLNGYKCPNCQTAMQLELIPDFSHDTPWFAGKFSCPRCQAGK